MKTFSSKTFGAEREKQVKAIYYLTVGGEGVRAKDTVMSFRQRKDPLTVYKCSRSYLFAGGMPSAAGNPIAEGEVQIYFSLLPESFLKEMERPGKRRRWMQKLSITMDCAEAVLRSAGSLTTLFSEELCAVFEREQELPRELYGALLWKGRKEGRFKGISISLPEEYGFLMTEEVLSLIEPYLAGTETVVFTGKETGGALDIEDYLYDEYGMVMCYEKYPADNSVWLDFGEQERILSFDTVSKQRTYPVNSKRILKFLDTTVKSGYNTKVN